MLSVSTDFLKEHQADMRAHRIMEASNSAVELHPLTLMSSYKEILYAKNK